MSGFSRAYARLVGKWVEFDVTGRRRRKRRYSKISSDGVVVYVLGLA